MTEPVSELHAAARDYAKRRLHVFPLHSPVDGRCSCGRDCAKPAKHPRTVRGFKDATTDLEQIDEWWSRWPDANIGIATGASGLAVLDVDPHHGGDESLYEREREHGEVPRTPRAQTGGGGEHVFFSENGRPE